MPSSTDLRYPIGPFTPTVPSSTAVRQAAVAEIVALPRRMRDAVAGLSDAQLAEVYPWEDWILAVSAVDTVLPEDDLLAGLRGRMSW